MLELTDDGENPAGSWKAACTQLVAVVVVVELVAGRLDKKHHMLYNHISVQH